MIPCQQAERQLGVASGENTVKTLKHDVDALELESELGQPERYYRRYQDHCSKHRFECTLPHDLLEREVEV